MKVRELIEALQTMDPDREVIMQKGADGNDYSPLYGVDADATYRPESTWHGKIYPGTLDPNEYDEWDYEPRDGGMRVVVLWPAN